jgi:hypothetical protein
VADVQAVAAALQVLNDRVESIATFVNTVRPLVGLADQAPALVAMLGDSFDDVMRQAIDSGIDVERGLLNGASAALRFGASMDTAKVRELEALLQSGVFDPAVVRIIGGLGRALVDSAAARPAPVGMVGLLKAVGDPDVQRALGFLVTFAERFGRQLREPQPAQP